MAQCRAGRGRGAAIGVGRCLSIFARTCSYASFAASIDGLRYVVGGYQAAQALKTLFPASFSLMFGAIRGAAVVKTLLPSSRLPGYALPPRPPRAHSLLIPFHAHAHAPG